MCESESVACVCVVALIMQMGARPWHANLMGLPCKTKRGKHSLARMLVRVMADRA